MGQRESLAIVQGSISTNEVQHRDALEVQGSGTLFCIQKCSEVRLGLRSRNMKQDVKEHIRAITWNEKQIGIDSSGWK
jgi:hypothetical protein